MLPFQTARRAGNFAAMCPAAGGGGYVGPGDTNATAFAWWGLRAYSLAKCGTKCVRLVRASDSAQSDFNTLTDGTFDISAATTWMAATTAKVVTFYDQSGGLKSFGAALDLTQATDANRPAFILGAGPGGVQPAIRYSVVTQVLAEYSGTAQSAVTTVYAQSKRTGAFTSSFPVLAQDGAGWQIGGGNAADKAGIFAGTFVYVTATDNVWHTVSAQLNGASTVASVDGSTSTVNPGTQFTTPNYQIKLGVNSAVDVFEAGIWARAVTI